MSLQAVDTRPGRAANRPARVPLGRRGRMGEQEPMRTLEDITYDAGSLIRLMLTTSNRLLD